VYYLAIDRFLAAHGTTEVVPFPILGGT